MYIRNYPTTRKLSVIAFNSKKSATKRISSMLSAKLTSTTTPPKYELVIIYEDAHIIAINKPANMLSVPAKLNTILSSTATATTIAAEQQPRPRPRRYEEWGKAVRNAINYTTNEITINCLENLKNVDNVPRKKKSFKDFIGRNFKSELKGFQASEVEMAKEDMWTAVSKADIDMHRLPLNEVTLKNRSAYEILRDRMGYNTFVSSPCRKRKEEEIRGSSSSNSSSRSSSSQCEEEEEVKVEMEENSLYVVHRLDCETSGILLFAKNSQAAGELCHQFRSKEISKLYLARVHGVPPRPVMLIDSPLGPHPDPQMKPRYVVVPVQQPSNPGSSCMEGKGGKEAKTYMKVLESYCDKSINCTSNKYDNIDTSAGDDKDNVHSSSFRRSSSSSSSIGSGIDSGTDKDDDHGGSINSDAVSFSLEIDDQDITAVSGNTEGAMQLFARREGIINHITDSSISGGGSSSHLADSAVDSTQCHLSSPSVSSSSLVMLEPITGRSHQLRVHLQSLGCPILGDSLYAPPLSEQPEIEQQEVKVELELEPEPSSINDNDAVMFSKEPPRISHQYTSNRLALHAYKIRLRHPITRELLELKASLRDATDYKLWLAAFGESSSKQ